MRLVQVVPQLALHVGRIFTGLNSGSFIDREQLTGTLISMCSLKLPSRYSSVYTCLLTYSTTSKWQMKYRPNRYRYYVCSARSVFYLARKTRGRSFLVQTTSTQYGSLVIIVLLQVTSNSPQYNL